MLKWFISLGILALLAGCGEHRYPSDIMEGNVSGIARQGDVWLEKELEVAGPGWAKVGLIFGYDDNQAGCSDIANAMMKERGLTFRCTVIAK